MRDLFADLGRLLPPSGAARTDVTVEVSRKPLGAERRQATVLQCVLALTDATKDAQLLVEQVPAFQRLAGLIVTRYDGQIAIAAGDAVSAYFAFPQVHEGDARRSRDHRRGDRTATRLRPDNRRQGRSADGHHGHPRVEQHGDR